MLPSRLWLATLVAILHCIIAGCATTSTSTPFETRNNGALQQDHYDVIIESHDGTRLRATVFQPALAPGETAPLVIHAHGFGVFRMSGPLSIYGQAIYSGIAAKEVWQNKYWVISYDERGHGQSDGMIRVMDPDYEVKDVSAILDWATANIRRISADTKGDVAIGMIGESYGGGAQLLSSIQDKRIDALIPITTWNSFQTALTPGQVPKSGWLTTLVVAGNALNPGHMEPVLNRAYWQARSGRVEKEIFDFLATHSPRYHCDNGDKPNADILLIQGMRDVLFPLNEAVENYKCMADGKHDVRLIATQGGHLLPFTQWSLIPGYQVESEIQCDGKQIDLSEMAVHWFDEKLKGIKGKADSIPGICITHDDQTGTSFTRIPDVTQRYTFERITLHNNFTGFFEAPLGAFDTAVGWFLPRMHAPTLADHTKADTSIRPAFIPLQVARSEGILAGVPEIRLNMTAKNPHDEPIAFLGIAVKRASSRKIELLSDQITPVRGAGLHTGQLAGISTRLHKDDIVGIWAAEYSNQYRFSGGDWFTATTLQGEVGLPMFGKNPSGVAAAH
jgi:ABC-2 type transport system ATP-binding protein